MDVLVIEDTSDIADIIKARLNIAGYSVDIALSGEEAAQKLETMTFRLIILDIMLPRVDGFEMARRIRASEKTKDIPIIAVTGLDIPGIVQKCQQAGANEVMMKPFEPMALLQKVDKYLGRKTTK